MKRIARAQQPVVGVEVVLKPVEVQVPPLAVPVEVRDIAVAIAVGPETYRVPSKPLPIEYSPGCIESGI